MGLTERAGQMEYARKSDKMRAKNNKGILLPETMKIIIAVLCIAALIYLAVKMGGILTQKNQLEQAKATIKEIAAKVNSVEAGEDRNSIVLSPKDWYILSFGADDSPNACAAKACVCMCDDKKCSDLYGCEQIDKEVILENAEGEEITFIGEETPFGLDYTLSGDNVIVQVKNE